MATTATVFNHIAGILGNALSDLDAATWKLALVASAYTQDLTDTAWADISASEVATGAGYTTGGETLTTVSSSTTAGVWSLAADDVPWTALTKDFRWGVLYISGTVNSITNPVVALILFDDSPADVSLTSVNYTVVWTGGNVLQIQAA